MKIAELTCSNSDNKFFIKRKGMKTLLVQKFEAGVIDFIIEDLSLLQQIKLLNISTEDLEDYFFDKLNKNKEYCLEILSRKWYWIETGDKLQMTKIEFEELNFRTFSELKQNCKKGKLSVKEMNLIIDCFTNTHSEFYNKD